MSTHRIHIALAALLGALLIAPAAHAAHRTYNVDPATGKDGNGGGAAKPLHTLAAALRKAQAGDTVVLAGGRYAADANGEPFSTVNGPPTVVVPAGVTLRGAPPGGVPTRLAGAPNQIGLLLSGDASVKDVQTLDFGVGVQAAAGRQRLSGTNLRFEAAASASPAAPTWS